MAVANKAIKKALAAIEKEVADRNEQIKKKLRVVCDDLFVNLVATVEANYDGEGDSGDIYAFTLMDADGNRVDYKMPDAIQSALLDACFEYLPSGFEIDAGGFGVVTLDVRKKTIKIAHSTRIVDTHEETHNYTF